MKRHPHPLTIHAAVRRQAKINPKPAYQRGPVWSTKQRQLLMDSLLRDLDVPKLYLRQVKEGGYEYEVVDGQQRLRAIWDFVAGRYPLAKDADPVNGEEVAGKCYADLSEDIKDMFDAYELSVVELQEASMEEVEEMFLRLQNGTSLNAAEKRNAMPGRMKEFVRDLAGHEFFASAMFTGNRYAYDQVAAQMALIELSGDFCNVKDKDLARMYEEHADFDDQSPKARRVRRTLDFLARAFPTKTPEIVKKYHAVSLYLLASRFLDQYTVKDRPEDFARAFVSFEEARRSDDELPEDQRDPRMVSYQERTSHSTDSHDSLKYRHEVLAEHFLLKMPDLKRLDGQRDFTHEQKVAIWRRDDAVCQGRIKCDGVKCEWDAWEADHRAPWSKGGPTTVENGQVLCIACNRAKSDGQ